MYFVQRSFPVLRLILSLRQWHELVRDVDYMCTTSYYRSSSHFWKPHWASLWVSFDLVNHRKAPPVNLPLDLKDVCGFPPSHPSPQRRWGWREVILVYVGPSAQSCFSHELSNWGGLLMCSNERRKIGQNCTKQPPFSLLKATVWVEKSNVVVTFNGCVSSSWLLQRRTVSMAGARTKSQCCCWGWNEAVPGSAALHSALCHASRWNKVLAQRLILGFLLKGDISMA